MKALPAVLAILLTTSVLAQQEGDVRLESNNAVMIYHSSSWRYVCDDIWDMNDAEVVCRQLGLGSASSAPITIYVSSSFWLDNVECTGTEEALSDCPANSWGYENCNGGEGAGAVCSGSSLNPPPPSPSPPYNSSPPPPSPVPPNGATTYGSGNEGDVRLESNDAVMIYHSSSWRYVCDDSWDMNDADVVCRQLGFARATSAPQQVSIPSDSFWLDDVACSGSESRLSDCPANSWGNENCGMTEGAGAVCADGGAGFLFYGIGFFVLFVMIASCFSLQMSRRIQRAPPPPPPRQQITPSAQQVTPMTAAMVNARVQAAREKSRQDRAADYMYDGPSQSIADEIQKLSELRAQGMLDGEQFEQAKAQLLGTPTVTAMVVDATAIPFEVAQPMVMAQPVMAELVQPAGQPAVPVAYASGQAAVPVAYATGTSCQRV